MTETAIKNPDLTYFKALLYAPHITAQRPRVDCVGWAALSPSPNPGEGQGRAKGFQTEGISWKEAEVFKGHHVNQRLCEVWSLKEVKVSSWKVSPPSSRYGVCPVALRGLQRILVGQWHHQTWKDLSEERWRRYGNREVHIENHVG